MGRNPRKAKTASSRPAATNPNPAKRAIVETVPPSVGVQERASKRLALEQRVGLALQFWSLVLGDALFAGSCGGLRVGLALVHL